MRAALAVFIYTTSGALALALTRWANNRRSKALRLEDGWHELSPSWFVVGLTIVCFAFCALPVAAARENGLTSDLSEGWALYALFLFFGGGGLYTGWHAFVRRIRWKGREIAVHQWPWPTQSFSIEDVASVEDKPTRSETWIYFLDGSKLKVSKLLNGATELTARAMSAAAQH